MASNTFTQRSLNDFDVDPPLDLPPAKCAAGLELAARLRVLSALLDRLFAEEKLLDGVQRAQLHSVYAENRVHLERFIDHLDPARTSTLRRHITTLVPSEANESTESDTVRLKKLIKTVTVLSTNASYCATGN